MRFKNLLRFIKRLVPGVLLVLILTFTLLIASIYFFYFRQKQLRKVFIDVLGVDNKQELDLNTVKELEAVELDRELIRKKITFESSFGEEIPCFLFYSSQWEKRPAVIVPPGRGEGIVETAGIKEGYQKSNALRLAEAGFVTLTCENRGLGMLRMFYRPDLEKELHRIEVIDADELEKREEKKLFKQVETVDLPRVYQTDSYLGLVVGDYLRALDYLQSLDFVDKNKIGAAGISLGGETAFYLAAIDARIKSVVVMGWLTTWSELNDDIQDWKAPGLTNHFPSMAKIGMLLVPRFSLFHNGLLEGVILAGGGFPPDTAKLIHDDIRNYYLRVFAPLKTEFKSRNVEHVFVNDLAIEFLDKTLNKENKFWIINDLEFLLKYYYKNLIHI